MTSRTGVLEEERTRSETAHAPRWKVILHDDPITTFEFVVQMLREVFRKAHPEAWRITQEAHSSGAALVEVTHFEEAEFRCGQARSLARARGFPLALTMEPADG